MESRIWSSSEHFPNISARLGLFEASSNPFVEHLIEVESDALKLLGRRAIGTEAIRTPHPKQVNTQSPAFTA